MAARLNHDECAFKVWLAVEIEDSLEFRVGGCGRRRQHAKIDYARGERLNEYEPTIVAVARIKQTLFRTCRLQEVGILRLFEAGFGGVSTSWPSPRRKSTVAA
jgi:hypothetical protein